MEKINQIMTLLVLLLVYLELVQIQEISANKVPRGEKFGLLNSGGSISMCGAPLTYVLQLVCNNKFNTMFKRSEDVDGELDYWSPLYEDESSTFPFRKRHMAKALIPGSLRRVRRGVVDECCKKSCSIVEMKSYCRP